MEKYIVTLSDDEVAQLQALTSKGRHAAAKVVNALVLLNCDQAHGSKRTTQEIAEFLQVSPRKIDRLKRRFVEDGLDAALNRQQVQRQYEPKIDGELEAQLIAMSCSAAPSGHARWSLRLLADRLVELELVQAVSHETVRQVLKKTNSSPGARWGG